MRFDCGKESSFVGITVIEDEHYRPRRCIWANPSPGKPLTLRFLRVPLRGKLRGYGGVSYFDERDGKGGSVELEAFVEGHSLGKFEHLRGTGWIPFAFDSSAFRDEERDLELRIRATRGVPRGFCFQADIR
jgi:hypothetical protein